MVKRNTSEPSASRSTRLAILDRDGTINKWVHHLTSERELELIPGSAEAIARLNRNNTYVAILTNQSVVGRGLLSIEGLERIHRRLASMLAVHGAHVDEILACLHSPARGCECRKPSPSLAQQVIDRLGVNRDEVVLIGDTREDLETAERAGIRGMLVHSGRPLGRDWLGAGFRDLAAAVDSLLREAEET